MFEIFSQEMDVTIVMLFLFVVSILCKLIPGIWYLHLIREVDNMAGTSSMLLKQCKLKFSNCYQLNGRVANIGIFVDKFISRLKVGPFSFDGVDHFSRQALVLSIFAGGVGVCRSLIKGRYFLEIMPFYLACFIAIYLYYMVAGMVDIRNLKRLLRVNLIDYLENHLSSRLHKTSRDNKELSEDEVPLRKKTVNVPLTQLSKKEPEFVKKEEDVATKELEPLKEVIAREPVDEISRKETKESPVEESADKTAPAETKKKTTAKRTIKQAAISDKSQSDLKAEAKPAAVTTKPRNDSKEVVKEKPVTEQIPPRSIDPEEIRKVLQELLGYSQA